jgi:DNA excision repair protein ERCC-2
MDFSLEARTAAMSVGEFADFSLGPRDSNGGPQGIWRAQLGTHWHVELRSRATAEHAAAAEFEIPITGRIAHRGWTLTFTGRIDQLIRTPSGVVLREIKTVTRALPVDESELRRDYPEYFIQAATYAALARSGLLAPAPAPFPLIGDAPLAASTVTRTELVFVETSSGLAQTIALTPADEQLFRNQLERIAEFLNLRLRARERLQNLRFQPAFAVPRPGQETTRAELTALFSQRPLILFEAPTGFGKTGVLLEFALGQLQSGHFDRALYLTSKSTGQLQVVRTLQAMTNPVRHLMDDKPPAAPEEKGEVCPRSNDKPDRVNAVPGTTPVAAWHVRNKAEHCVNTTFHCVRDNCSFLADAEKRWAGSGLARFYLDERQSRDLDVLRAAGRDARICPYEITRAALAFNDVWIGDYNYVFAPRNRGLFFEQPGFAAPRTLLLIDEAHNLPSRVADAYSHGFTVLEAYAVRDELHRVRALSTLLTAWDQWCHALQHLRASPALPAGDEDDLRHLLTGLARLITSTPLDYAALGPHATEPLWQIPALMDELERTTLSRLWWCPRDGELALTCLDAGPAIGATLREFGGVVLASATLTPVDSFAGACGLANAGNRIPAVATPLAGKKTIREGSLSGLRSPVPGSAPPASSASAPVSPDAPPERLGTLTKRDTRKLFRQLTSAAELLRVEEERDAASPALLRAHAPWRDGAYAMAFDGRVDTTFQHRSHYYEMTGDTVARLHAAAQGATTPQCSAVFFPSYAYAEAIAAEVTKLAPNVRVAMQPKLRDLAAQSAWVEQALMLGDALFLVLGSSFAESIDLLGGRVSHAMVVGPALPEVNAVQRARLAEAAASGLSRDEAFRRVYQVPGMTKVNQALGRLVRAPGQQARVLLHCRRFQEPSYRDLLAPEYQSGRDVRSDAELHEWIKAARP